MIIKTVAGRKLIATCAAFRIRAEDDSLHEITRLALRELAQRINLRTRPGRDPTGAGSPPRPHPNSLPARASAPTPRQRCWSPPAITAPAQQRTRVRQPLRQPPVPVNSGQTQNRYRLNRGGDRQANAALWRIAIVRMGADPRTSDYIARRVKDGKTKSEAIRCLKRYITREIFNALPRAALT